MALLTPNDIRNHIFQTVRFKEGYDIDEVDDFLDEVTETIEALSSQAAQSGSTQSLGPDVAALNEKISQLSNENAQLTKQLSEAQAAAQQAAPDVNNEQMQAVVSQNNQLKAQVDQLNAQIDQLTAQSAKGDGTAAQLESERRRSAELAGQLRSAQQQITALQSQTVASDKNNDQVAALTKELQASKAREEQLRDQLSKVEPPTETGSLRKIAGAGATANTEPERATAMIALAMQLHDQYVDKGKAQRDQLITDGQAKYENAVKKADAYSARVHNDADEYSQKTRSEADQYSQKTRTDADTYSQSTHEDADDYAKKTRNVADEYDRRTRGAAEDYAEQVKDKLYADSKVIEGNIEGLKQFETEYRSRLTEFLDQLTQQISDTNNYQTMGQPKLKN